MELIEGRNVHLIGAGHQFFDSESNTLMPVCGCAVVFAYGFTPSIVDLAHVKVKLFTTAFESQLSTRRDRTSCSAVGGCAVRFAEKSLTDWWGKYVLLVT